MRFDKGTCLALCLALVCILLTLVAIGAAQAEEENGAHRVIARELAAIKARDADAAYGLLGDTLHAKFDAADDYLAHLRLESRPLYNHRFYTFLKQTPSENGLVQQVEIRDRRGAPATIIYRLRQDKKGAWRIDSFAVLETTNAEPI